jgi:hypothetical protein
MVVGYRKEKSKIVFESYPKPTIEEALDQFANAAIFSVLDLKLRLLPNPSDCKQQGH